MMSNRLLALFLLCSGGISAARLYESVEPHMGTLFRIKLYADSDSAANCGFKAAFKRISQLDNILSDYKPDSELNLAAKAAVSKPVHVSTDLARVLEVAQQIAAESGGAFDITVGQLTKLWRSARHNGQLPATEDILSARQRCDYRKLHVDSSASTIMLDSPGIEIDLGGIAKGYAADEALASLSKLGIHSALVAASGDLAFGDAPPGQSGWKIGIDSFDRADKPFTRVLWLTNAAVSTSGGTQQNLDFKGKRYSHILNPATGMGLETDISVTTIARRGIVADAAATAVSVLGVQPGMAFVERRRDLAAFMLDGNHAYESSLFHSVETTYASNLH